jgi:hypothetical protein
LDGFESADKNKDPLWTYKEDKKVELSELLTGLESNLKVIMGLVTRDEERLAQLMQQHKLISGITKGSSNERRQKLESLNLKLQALEGKKDGHINDLRSKYQTFYDMNAISLKTGNQMWYLNWFVVLVIFAFVGYLVKVTYTIVNY